ncbi:hypothetical protein B5F07_11330 [Lachnoclostridium sp. An169]|uniref:uroporphyrinogen decarboxylase family protein n=1 Tax=Lachnoclostridium sp. An169 TaxID=1965569 RepID=UPI000B39D8A4|nr:uroporphyrinogen decarboxylase family protein [Lachnoclostridium sp. An169]OUP83263.1 hypothetical protein B5F07_11330 [Lachnoclostridium sp. An169]
MTPRERLLCVLRGEIPDRVPVSPFVQEEYLSWYFDRKNTSRLYDAVQLAKELDFDLITRQYINPIPYFLKKDAEGWRVTITEGKEGNNYVRRTTIVTPERTLQQVEAAEYNEKILSGIHFSTTEYLLKEQEDFEAFRKYCPKHSSEDEEFILSQGVIAKEEVGDLGITCPWAIGGVYNLVATYMDVQDMLCDALADEEYYEEYMNYFTDMVAEENEIYARSVFDAVGIQGNIANGAIMGADYFDQYVLPYERRALDVLIRAGKPTIYHNCGNAKVLYPEYKKLGITVWETVSPKPQGDNVLEEAKDYFGTDLILSGNFDQVHFLKEASPEEIEKCAYEQMMVGKKGGHYIFACSDYLETGTPLENVKALLRGAKAAAEYK